MLFLFSLLRLVQFWLIGVFIVSASSGDLYILAIIFGFAVFLLSLSSLLYLWFCYCCHLCSL